MQQTKLLKVFAKLDRHQTLRFKKFVSSPIFNPRQDVIDLVGLLRRDWTVRPSHLTKEKVWQQIFPDSQYDDQKMRLLISTTFKQLEKFLAWSEISTDTVLLKSRLSKAYEKLGLDQLHQRTYAATRLRLKKQPHRDLTFLKNQHDLEYEFYISATRQKRISEINLQSVSDSFDRYVIAGKLKFACFTAAHNLVYRKIYENRLVEQILLFIEEQPSLLDEPAISIYYHAYLAMIAEEHEVHFHKFREEIARHSQKFGARDIRAIYIMALNYCTRQMNRGSEAYTREAFRLYEAGLENGFLFDNKQISPYSYSNIVFIALTLKAYEWVEKFVDNYSRHLPDSGRKPLSNLAKASLQYHQKDYDGALMLLQDFETTDPLLVLRMRNLRIRIYYELGEIDLLQSHLKSTTVYLSRKEVAPHLKILYQSFLQLTAKLIKLEYQGEDAIRKFLDEIRELKARPLRKWLAQQAMKLPAARRLKGES